MSKQTVNAAFDLSATQNESFLTALTPEQAAVVEGGRRMLRIRGLQAVRAGADTFGADDTYITVNGQKLWGAVGMSTGNYREVNRDVEIGSTARVNLFDEDGFLNGDDDYMGGFDVSGVTGGLRRVRVYGGGSIYDVYYGTYDAPDF